MQDEPMRPVPRAALIGAALLIGFVIVMAGTARITGIGITRVPDSAPVAVRELRFEDRMDGGVAVLHADGRVIEVLASGSNGFVRTVMRSLARERRMNAASRDIPFRLTRWADGRLSVDDPTTGRSVDLGAFGSSNYAAFARLMNPQMAAQ